MAFVILLLLYYITTGAKFMYRRDPAAGRYPGFVLAWWQAAARAPSFWKVIGAALRYFKPGYTPHHEGSTEQALAYLARSPAAQRRQLGHDEGCLNGFQRWRASPAEMRTIAASFPGGAAMAMKKTDLEKNKALKLTHALKQSSSARFGKGAEEATKLDRRAQRSTRNRASCRSPASSMPTSSNSSKAARPRTRKG